jgi:hypothetical protein
VRGLNRHASGRGLFGCGSTIVQGPSIVTRSTVSPSFWFISFSMA